MAKGEMLSDRKALNEVKMKIRKAQNSSGLWKKSKEKLDIMGPLALAALGILWLMQGFGMLPSFLDVPWLGAILIGLGLSRVVMYFMGYY